MLPTCQRCQKRKIKCDKGLPACSPCASAELECSFYDPVTKQSVPRSYIKRLDDNVRKLKAEIARLKRSCAAAAQSSPSSHPFELPSQTQIEGSIKTPYTLSFWNLQTSSASFLGPGSATAFALAAVGKSPNYFDHAEIPHVEPPPSCRPDLDKVDKSIITIAAVRDLIERYYIPLVHQRYPIVDTHQFELDTTLKRLPLKRRFTVIMAAAIGATVQGRVHPEMQTIALTLRNWADELYQPLLRDQNGVALEVLLLLIFYELADPHRGLAWTLIGLATRLCFKLSKLKWYEVDEKVHPVLFRHRRTLIYSVYEIERFICQALGRPTLLPDSYIAMPDASTPQNNRFIRVGRQSRLHHLLLESPNTCPFRSEVVLLLREILAQERRETIFELSTHACFIMLHSEADHQLCPSCATPSRFTAEIKSSAQTYIDMIHSRTGKGLVLCVWMYASYLFKACCVLVDVAKAEGDKGRREAIPRLLKACSVMASFSVTWVYARAYKEVLEGLVKELVDSAIEASTVRRQDHNSTLMAGVAAAVAGESGAGMLLLQQ